MYSDSKSNLAGTFLLSFFLHCLLFLSILLIPIYTKNALSDKQLFMVDLIEQGSPGKGKGSEPAKPPEKKTEDIKPPEPEKADEKEPELSIPKPTPKKEKPKATPEPKPEKEKPKATPEPTKKPETKKSTGKSTKTETEKDENKISIGNTTGDKGSVSLSIDKGEGGGGQGGNVAPWLASYANTLRNIIYYNWNNPFIDLKKGEKIVASVRFTILRSGQVENVMIEKTSGNVIYDLAGIRAVKSSPYPPLPAIYPYSTLTIFFNFTYNPQE